MTTPDQRVEQLGIKLTTKIPKGKGLVSCVQDGHILYVSGNGPEDDKGNLLFVGKVGKDLTVEEAYQAARLTGIQLLRSIHDFLGSLNRVDRIIKVLAFVNSADNFHDQPSVVHGFSDLMVEIFGENGKHARSAIGTSNLPGNQPIEIEMILRIRE